MSRRSRARCSLFSLVAVACIAVGAPAASLAQETAQQLPDPDNPAEVDRAQSDDRAAAKEESSALPSTGLPALALLVAGMSLIAGGVAVRPARRRRRSYNSQAWLQAVERRKRRRPAGLRR